MVTLLIFVVENLFGVYHKWFVNFSSLILQPKIENQDKFLIRKIKLYDNDEAWQDLVARASEVFIKERAPEIEFLATTDPKEGFTDVDFVIKVLFYIRMKSRVIFQIE